MTKPRKELISLDSTPYYHCVSRCVRRAFLCGKDSQSKRDFEHRRQWIEDKLLTLSNIFAIDLCAYSVMSNHYHVVLHVNTIKADTWTQREICERWHRLFKGTPLSHRFLRGDQLSNAEQQLLIKLISVWQSRLQSISWFMRIINEGIARQANKEDQCTGRFWEGRFKSQALLDEKALAACMVYVDLNPIRAKIAQTPETSDHTSIKLRINTAKKLKAPYQNSQPPDLMPFSNYRQTSSTAELPFQLKEYLQLVDWTSHILQSKKGETVHNSTPPLLNRLNINHKCWLYCSQHFESKFRSWIGSAYKLKAVCQRLGYQRIPTINICQHFLG